MFTACDFFLVGHSLVFNHPPSSSPKKNSFTEPSGPTTYLVEHQALGGSAASGNENPAIDGSP